MADGGSGWDDQGESTGKIESFEGLETWPGEYAFISVAEHDHLLNPCIQTVFFEACSRYKVSVFNVPPNQVEAEILKDIEAATSLAGA